MDNRTRKHAIRRMTADVGRIQDRLNQCFGKLQAIADAFRTERGDILRDIRKQTKRSPSSNLLLRVTVRQGSTLNVPSAKWKHITARGKSTGTATQAAFTTAGGHRRGQMSVFGDFIKTTKKYGYSMRELRPHAHPAELDLVARTEADLTIIRRTIVDLRDTAMKMIRARRRYELTIARAESGLDTKTPPRKAKRQVKHESGPTTGDLYEHLDEKPMEKPQLRNPERFA